VIRELLVAVLLAASTVARAADDDPPLDTSPLPGASDGEEGADDEDGETEDPLRRHRTEFDVLLDRTIGTASRPSAFNWRRTAFQVAGTGSFLAELNNFNSGRVGVLGRLPTGGTILELGVNYVFVGDTPSSRQLALTPYRQPGRPRRLEIDVNLGIPLAEGVVTTSPKFFPALQLVFNGYASLRYSLYPQGFRGLRFRRALTALAVPSLRDDELENLDDIRLDAMQVDRGRYALLLGFGNDIYFRQGLFLSPRVMFAVPLLAPATNTDLLFWTDFSLAVGVAF